MSENSFPFVFLNHGKPIDTYSFQGEKHLIIWFQRDVPEKLQKKIEKLCPKPLRQMFTWGSQQVYNYSMSDESYLIDYYSAKSDVEKIDFSNKKSSERYFLNAFQTFSDDIETWILKVNEIATIHFVIGLNRISGSDWDKWSMKNIEQVMSFIENFENKSEKSPSEDFVIEQTKELLKDIPNLKNNKFKS